MTSTPSTPPADGEDLAQLREEIDELQAIPEEELVLPTPAVIAEGEPEPEPTDPIGSADGDESASATS